MPEVVRDLFWFGSTYAYAWKTSTRLVGTGSISRHGFFGKTKTGEKQDLPVTRHLWEKFERRHNGAEGAQSGGCLTGRVFSSQTSFGAAMT